MKLGWKLYNGASKKMKNIKGPENNLFGSLIMYITATLHQNFTVAA